MNEETKADLVLIFNRNFNFITIINLFVMVADYQFFITAALYAIEVFDAHLSEAGAASGSLVIGCLIGRFVTGNLISILGAKKTLCIGTFLFSLSALMVIGANSLWIFTFERFLFGICIGIVSTATGTIMAYSIPIKVQGLGVSIFSLSTALSLALGPFIGLGIAHNFGFDIVNLEVITLCIISFILSIFLNAPTKLKNTNKSLFKLSNYVDKRVSKFAIVALIVPIGYGCISAYLAAMCQERGMDYAASLFFLTVSVMTIISRPVAGRIFDLCGENAIIYPSIILAGGAPLLLAFAHSPFMIILAGIMHGIGLCNFQSSGQALALKLVDRSRYAQATSTFFIFWDFSMGLTPYLLGFIAVAWGFGVMFITVGAIVLSGALIYYFVHGKDHPLKRKLFRHQQKRH